MKIRTLFLIFWIILSAVGILSFAGKSKAEASLELTYTGQPGSLFNETNLAPTDSVTKQITVKNLTVDTQKFALNLQNFLGIANLPQTGYNAISSVFAVLTVLFFLAGFNLFIVKFKGRDFLAKKGKK